MNDPPRENISQKKMDIVSIYKNPRDFVNVVYNLPSMIDEDNKNLVDLSEIARYLYFPPKNDIVRTTIFYETPMGQIFMTSNKIFFWIWSEVLYSDHQPSGTLF